MTTHSLSELSILIVTWNGDELLKNCLDSLRRACGEVPEIVVVDNANLDSTKTLVAAHPNAKYIAAPENLGFAGGNNLGLPLCTRPYILLLNNDTIVHEEPFSQLIQYLKDHPKVAVVQGKMRLALQGDVLDECGSYLTSWGELYSRYLHASVKTKVESGPVFHAKGACLMFKRSILDSLDGVLFYNHFKSYYEDADFCHRVWLTGHEVHFLNTPPIDHFQGATAKKIEGLLIPEQALRNKAFSFLSLFNATDFLTRFTPFLIFHFGIIIRRIIALDIGYLILYWHVIHSLLKSRNAIVNIRQKYSPLRKSNGNFLKSVTIKQTLAQTWQLWQGNDQQAVYKNAEIKTI